MKITVSHNQKTQVLDLDAASLIEDVKALIEVELGIPYTEQLLKYKNATLVDDKTLAFYKIKEGDVLTVSRMPFFASSQLSNNIFGPGLMNMDQNLMNEALQIKAHYENSPNELQFILHQDPTLAQAVLSDDIRTLMDLLAQRKHANMQKKMKELEEITALNADPMNPENQRKIEELINKKNIDENYHLANEFMPENFGTVTMLYIDIKINKLPIQAFVDSGAQSTIMSRKCAEKCNIMRLVDKRYAGMALGVGQAKIIGRIHAIDMQISDKFFTCSLTILDDDKIEFLFGLDMLKRHECKIDLKKNVLSIADGLIEVPFLSEGVIKKTIASGFLEQEEQKAYEEQLMKEAIESSKKETSSPQINKNINKNPAAQPNKPIQQPQIPNPQLNSRSNLINFGIREEDIKKLTDLSFSREAAIRALRATGGDPEKAAALLFAESGNFF